MMSFAGSGAWFALCLHLLFFVVAAFGVLTAIIMLVKSKDEKMLKRVMLVTLIVGVVGLLITAPFAHKSFIRHGGSFYDRMPMMLLENGDLSDKDDYLNKMRERMEKAWDETEAELKEDTQEVTQ